MFPSSSTHMLATQYQPSALLTNRQEMSTGSGKLLNLHLNNITFYKHRAHLINLKTVSIRLFHSTESMLSPLIVHAFPYAAFIPPCSSSSRIVIIVVFMKTSALFFFFFFWHIIICTHARKSRRVKNAKKKNLQMPSVSSQLNGHRLMKKNV